MKWEILLLLFVITACTVQDTGHDSTPKKVLSQKEFSQLISDTEAQGRQVYSELVMEATAKDVGASNTNVQVEGVDEGDFVKNDGEYVYMLSGGSLLIIKEDILSQTKLDHKQRAKQMFIHGDRLILFSEGYEKTVRFNRYDITPYPSTKQITYAHIYDIADRESPELLETIEMTGTYYESRLIDDVVYFVAREYAQYWPVIRHGGGLMEPEVYYFNDHDNYYLNTIASISLNDAKLIEAQSYLLGHSNTLMVSKDNIYMTYQESTHRNEDEKERFFGVILPVLKGSIKEEINRARIIESDEDKEWGRIQTILTKYFEDEEWLDENEDMLDNVAAAIEEYDTQTAIKQSSTTIHRFAISGGKIKHEAEGRIEGRLLNQFSMDEHKSRLRVATTTDVWSRERMQYNNVFVLNKDLNVIGSLKGIADGERIYSSRFEGDKLYLVTFKQIDPFFVIDLSDTKPKILGYLKIPGFSNYLHQIDENTVMGIGKETDEGTIQGVKISLFDITDLKNPKELDKKVIGDRGSHSAAINDHKAVLIDGDFMVLPIERRESSSYFDEAYFFDIKDGIKIIGTVLHSKTNNYNWQLRSRVSRALFIDDKVYTISQKYVIITDKNTLEEINKIRLPLSDPYEPMPYLYDRGVDIAVEGSVV